MDAIMASLEMISWNLPGGTEENHGNFSQHSLNLGQDMKLRLSEYESGVTNCGATNGNMCSKLECG